MILLILIGLMIFGQLGYSQIDNPQDHIEFVRMSACLSSLTYSSDRLENSDVEDLSVCLEQDVFYGECPLESSYRYIIVGNDESAYVVFRGTQEGLIENTIDDLLSLHNPFYNNSGYKGEVHKGFYSELNQVYARIDLYLKKNLKKRKLYVVGYSSVAAIASLFVARRYVEGRSPTEAVCVFAPPRFADKHFVEFFEEVKPQPYLVFINEGDIVPLVPPRFFGYKHAFEEYLFFNAPTPKAIVKERSSLQLPFFREVYILIRNAIDRGFSGFRGLESFFAGRHGIHSEKGYQPLIHYEGTVDTLE